VFGFGFFQILEYFHIQNELFWGGSPNLNMQFIYFSYRPCTHSLQVISYNNFSNLYINQSFVLWNLPLWYHIGLQKVSEYEAFQSLDFWVRDSHPVL
jgi:hypothetical protein